MHDLTYSVADNGAITFTGSGHIYRLTDLGRGRPAVSLFVNGQHAHADRLDLFDATARVAFASRINGHAPDGVVAAELLTLVTIWEARRSSADSPPPESDSSDQAPAADASGSERGRTPSQATTLVQLVSGPEFDYFHDAAGIAYCTFTVDGVRQTAPLRVKPFRQRLARLFYV